MTDNIKLPPLDKWDHPEPRSFFWTQEEIRAIQDYAREAVRLNAQGVPDAIEKELLQAIQERDAADDYIDALLDEALGTDRQEWSSVYGHADAMEQVRERMSTLMKPSIDKAWDRFQSAVAPQPAQQPLTDEQIFDSWEFITGHQIQFGPRNEGRPMFISTDEVLEFTRAVEKAHGIGVKND